MKVIKLCVLFLGINVTIQAQEAIITTGGDASNTGGTVSYSIGQISYSTNTGTNGEVSQGVQHAYEIFTVGIKEKALNILLKIFPNPTTDYLTLQIQEYNNQVFECRIFDMGGKLIKKEIVVSENTQLNMNYLPPATYLITVLQGNKHIQSFKVIKN